MAGWGKHSFIGKMWPWAYTRQKLPGPGSENIAFRNLALNPYTPIGAGIANAAQFYGNLPTSTIPHLIGVQGLGGLLYQGSYAAVLSTVPTTQTPQPVYIVQPSASPPS